MTVLRAGAATDAGRVRQGNEDTPLVAEGNQLWAVADGMGGHRGGEVASRLAIEELQRVYAAGEPTEDGLADAAAAANAVVVSAGDDDPNLRGMGTTLVAIARTEDDDIAYVNVGDSRIYLLRDGELQRLTIDHSLVEELVQEGSITREEARTHPKRNVVTRALGISPVVRVDAATITPYTGDRYVLCSDGLTDEVDEDRIASVLRRIEEAGEAAAELVRLANENGGRDNITVVIVDVVDDDGRAATASRAVAGATSSSDPAGFATAAPERERTEPVEVTPAPRRARTKGPRRVTWRVAVFAVLLLAVIGAAVGAVGWYARNTYFVGVDGEQVAIFKGKPGGVLWFAPTLEQRTDLAAADLAPEARDDVERGVEFGDLSEAEAYLDRAVPTTTTTTTSTTTSTTATTVVAPTLPTTAPAPPP